MGARNWEGQVTGLTSRRKKKEGLLSALFGHGEEERRRPPAHRPERHTGGQNPAAAPFAHRTEGRRVNIDISLDAPERREGTAAPAHRTQPRRDTSPRSAARPQQRAAHDVLPEPYRKYYASVMKKPYYPVAVPLRQPEPPAPRAASYDVAEVWGAPPARPAFMLPDLCPSRRISRTSAAQAELQAATPDMRAETMPAAQAEPQAAAPDMGTETTPAAQAEPQAAAPDMGTETMPAAQTQDAAPSMGTEAMPAAQAETQAAAPDMRAEATPAAQARDGGEREPTAPPHDIWELLAHLHPQPSGRPAPLLRVDSTEQIEEPEPPQPEPEDNAEDEARAAAEREQARALGELLERAQAALPQPGEAPLKRAAHAEPVQEPQAEAIPAQSAQASNQPAQGMQAEVNPAQSAQASSQPAQGAQAETIPAQSSQASRQPAQSVQAETIPAQSAQASSQPAQGMQTEVNPAQGAQASRQPVQSVQSITAPAQSAPTDGAPAQEPQLDAAPMQGTQTEADPAQTGAASGGDEAEREALGRAIPPEERSHYVYVENDDWDEDDFFTDWDVERPMADEEDAAEADDGTEPDGEAAQMQGGASDEPAPVFDAQPMTAAPAAQMQDSASDEPAPVFDAQPMTAAPAAQIQDSASDEPAPVFDAQPVAAEPARPEPRPFSPPPSSLLEYSPEPDMESVEEELNVNGEKLIETLQSFGVRATMLEACRGPAVTRYELQPAAGVKISKITNLSDDIAMNLAATGVRIEAPIPGKAAVGIEVPNRKVSTVRMRELVESPAFRRAESPLTTVLGRDIAGELVLADLAKMPHLLIAGSTGSGKSVCINAMIVSLLYKSRPEDVRFLMIDPKVVELGVYNGIPQLIVPVVTDPRKAAGALGWAVTEMLRRYQLFAANNVRDLSSYNRLAQERGYVAESGARMEHMPRIVIIIDELADLMMAAPNEVEDSICRLAQMARAAGMHLVIATQRPSVDVITGIIKANIPSRIAFAVSSQVDSRTILDMGGAEKLLGRGDMLFSPLGVQKPVRVQGCFIDDREIEAVVDCIRGTASSEYDENVMEEIERGAAPEQETESAAPEGDAMIPEAVRCVVEAGQASTSLLQRRLRLGYARAGRLIDEMEQMGIVGPHEGSKPRQVLITWQQYLEMAQSRGWEH